MTAAQAASARLVAAGLRRQVVALKLHSTNEEYLAAGGAARIADLLRRAEELERDAARVAAGEEKNDGSI